MSAPSGNRGFVSLDSQCFPRFVSGNIETLGKTKLAISLGSRH